MIFLGYESVPEELKGSVIAIGNFDGVHIGHQEIIKTAVAIAKDNAVSVGVVTFDPHPSSVLGKVEDHRLLMSVYERANRLLEVGADFVIIVKFTREFSLLGAIEFIDIVLCNALRAMHVVTGYNFRFGAKGIGDTILLSKQADVLGFGFTQVNHIKYLGFEVSTSYIKRLISSGRILMAAHLLGQNYVLSGVLLEGNNVAGPLLCSPTANVGCDTILPLFGVYFARVKLESGRVFLGLANIGIRPTISYVCDPGVEVYLFDFNGRLYANTISIELISFIRPEREFESIDELIYATAADKAFGRYLCRNVYEIELCQIA